MRDERLIVALDMANFQDMQAMVEELGDSVISYKVGMELFYAEGSKTIKYLKDNGKEVFLDLKLYDIPNTVAKGISSLLTLGVDMITLHAQGGRIMMQTTMEMVRARAKELGVKAPKILAVTVLTSFDEEVWNEAGGSLPIADRVVKLAKLAQESGVDGVVASPLESELIRRECGEDFLIVTPGVRPSFAQTNDQKRISTPKDALKNGSTHLVIGRPITTAKNPKEAAKLILEEMNESSIS